VFFLKNIEFQRFLVGIRVWSNSWCFHKTRSLV